MVPPLPKKKENVYSIFKFDCILNVKTFWDIKHTVCIKNDAFFFKLAFATWYDQITFFSEQMFYTYEGLLRHVFD